MKQNLLKTWLLMLCMLVGIGSAWGEDATMTAGTNGTTATVNSKSAIKVGTSSKGGDMTITVPAGATSLEFYAAAWNGVTGLSLNITPAANVSPTSVSLTADTGISNNSPFTLAGTESSYKFTVALSNITAETTIKLTSSTTKRFVVWGATYTSAADTRTAVNMTGFSATSTTLIKGGTTNTSVTNDQNTWTAAYTYVSSNTNVATVSNDGVITAVAKGTATITASLNIANDDANWKKGATASKTIDITVNNPSHTYTFYSNGTSVSSGTIEEGEAITFPAEKPSIDDVVFIGWAESEISGTQDNAPTLVTSKNMDNTDANFYAVFATANEYGATATGTGLSATTSAQVLEAGKPITYKSSAANSYSDPVRIYKNGTFTIAGATMTQIVLEGNDNNNPATNLVLKSGEPGSISTGTNSVTWKGSATSVTFVASSAQARVKTITVKYGGTTYSDYCTTVSIKTLILDENATEIEDIYDEYDKVVVKRSIKANTWSTLCLPFAMSADQIATNFGEDAEVKILTGLTVNGTSYTMNFEDCDEIGAALPCMIRVSNAISEITVKGNVEVDTTEKPEDSAEKDDALVTFVGNYATSTVPENNGNYIISSNKFYFVDSAVTNKGFRGYFNLFTLDGASSDAKLSISFDGETTGISTIETTSGNKAVYNLAGQRVNASAKGILIQNGKKYIRK